MLLLQQLNTRTQTCDLFVRVSKLRARLSQRRFTLGKRVGCGTELNPLGLHSCLQLTKLFGIDPSLLGMSCQLSLKSAKPPLQTSGFGCLLSSNVSFGLQLV